MKLETGETEPELPKQLVEQLRLAAVREAWGFGGETDRAMAAVVEWIVTEAWQRIVDTMLLQVVQKYTSGTSGGTSEQAVATGDAHAAKLVAILRDVMGFRAGEIDCVVESLRRCGVTLPPEPPATRLRVVKLVRPPDHN